MAKGGRRPGSGRKPALQLSDAWVANKCNDLVLAGTVPRARKRMLANDPQLLSAFELMEEEENVVDGLPSAEKATVRAAIRTFNSTHIKDTENLPPHLQPIADALIDEIELYAKRMFAMKWVRNRGSIPPISSHEWGRIYQEVADLAAAHFGRSFTVRQIKESMRRENARAAARYALVAHRPKQR